MPLQKPTDEDQKKLHSEINQITNQRFLLSTLAVTIFGIVSTWIMKEPSTQNSEFSYLASLILLIVLFSLFYLMHRLRATLRTISSYLIETKSSGWEMDWKTFREKPYSSYTKAQTFLFLVLGILAICIPFTITLVYHSNFTLSFGVIAVISIGGMYILFLCGMGFGKWFDTESHAEERWRKLNKVKRRVQK